MTKTEGSASCPRLEGLAIVMARDGRPRYEEASRAPIHQFGDVVSENPLPDGVNQALCVSVCAISVCFLIGNLLSSGVGSAGTKAIRPAVFIVTGRKEEP